jgi:hypothetical protein
MFSWFDAGNAQDLGNSLAQFLIERIPLESAGRKSKSMAKKQEVLDKIFLKIQIFKIENKLNFYQKAKLCNAFKWKLIEANYDPDFVDELTKMLARQC